MTSEHTTETDSERTTLLTEVRTRLDSRRGFLASTGAIGGLLFAGSSGSATAFESDGSVSADTDDSIDGADAFTVEFDRMAMGSADRSMEGMSYESNAGRLLVDLIAGSYRKLLLGTANGSIGVDEVSYEGTDVSVDVGQETGTASLDAHVEVDDGTFDGLGQSIALSDGTLDLDGVTVSIGTDSVTATVDSARLTCDTGAAETTTQTPLNGKLDVENASITLENVTDALEYLKSNRPVQRSGSELTISRPVLQQALSTVTVSARAETLELEGQLGETPLDVAAEDVSIDDKSAQSLVAAAQEFSMPAETADDVTIDDPVA